MYRVPASRAFLAVEGGEEASRRAHQRTEDVEDRAETMDLHPASEGSVRAPAPARMQQRLSKFGPVVLPVARCPCSFAPTP